VGFRKPAADIERIDVRKALRLQRTDLDELRPPFLKLLEVLRIVELKCRVTYDADADLGGRD